jgi:hypothetical protein
VGFTPATCWYFVIANVTVLRIITTNQERAVICRKNLALANGASKIIDREIQSYRRGI